MRKDLSLGTGRKRSRRGQRTALTLLARHGTGLVSDRAQELYQLDSGEGLGQAMKGLHLSFITWDPWGESTDEDGRKVQTVLADLT